jgi:hypothetical protein
MRGRVQVELERLVVFVFVGRAWPELRREGPEFVRPRLIVRPDKKNVAADCSAYILDRTWSAHKSNLPGLRSRTQTNLSFNGQPTDKTNADIELVVICKAYQTVHMFV